MARFVGQPIAAVAAQDRKTALAALAIKVSYETLPSVIGAEAARKAGAPILFPGGKGQKFNAGEGATIRAPWSGNIRGPSAAFSLKKKSARIWIAKARSDGDPLLFEGTFRTGVQQHTCLEPHTAVARFDGDRLTVHVSTQFVEKGVKPPPGYATTGSICRAFLNQHAPKKADAGIPGASGSKPASPAQILFAEKLAQENGIVIPDEAKATSAAISTWIDSNQVKKRGRVVASVSTRQRNQSLQNPRFKKKRSPETRGECRCHGYSVNAGSGELGTDTPLRIPYGNKDAALKPGARYRAGGWYAPRASILLPSANAGGYRAKRRGRVEQASSWRCVRRGVEASAVARLNQFRGLPANGGLPDVAGGPLAHTRTNADLVGIAAVAERAVADGLHVENDEDRKPQPGRLITLVK